MPIHFARNGTGTLINKKGSRSGLDCRYLALSAALKAWLEWSEEFSEQLDKYVTQGNIPASYKAS